MEGPNPKEISRGLFCKSLISEIDFLNKDYYYFVLFAEVIIDKALFSRRS